MGRGFGIAAGVDLGVAGEIAAEAELLGYSSVWTNDTPNGDGPATAAAMMAATRTVRIGIGALACDRWSPVQIVDRLDELGINLKRLTLVVGAGRSSAPLPSVETTVSALRESLEESALIGVAALGPAMCRLAGRIGDFVLLNWATPEQISASLNQINAGAAKRGVGVSNDRPLVGSYVRLALGDQAGELLQKEASGYSRVAHYHRHFEAMGTVPGLAVTEAQEVSKLLAQFEEVLDETIVRAVPTSRELEDFLVLARAAGPTDEANPG